MARITLLKVQKQLCVSLLLRSMFHAAMLDARQFGKRYGMAQCTRDISRTDCNNCLYTQLMTFRTIIGNKRGWEVYGSSCSM
ncbi:hypothetical protein GOBAR_DD24110 [Gossypium barbadense]|nr:hypothetical protein GOBAR_DD24110 [Gossypium barbadense]